MKRKKILSLFLVNELVRAGFQYGHDFEHWRNQILPSTLFLYRTWTAIIFNTFLTSVFIGKALAFLRLFSAKGIRLLFVEDGRRDFAYFLPNFVNCKLDGAVSQAWVGGTLTNFNNVVLPTVIKIREGKKKIRSRPRRYCKNLSNFRFLPNAVINTSSTNSTYSTNEANLLAIPSLGIVDSNSFLNQQTFPFFGNDDSIEPTKLFLFFSSTAVESGRLRTTMRFFKIISDFILKRLSRIYIRLKRFKINHKFIQQINSSSRRLFSLNLLFGNLFVLKQLATEIVTYENQEKLSCLRTNKLSFLH